jgi:hypothetical protein
VEPFRKARHRHLEDEAAPLGLRRPDAAHRRAVEEDLHLPAPAGAGAEGPPGRLEEAAPEPPRHLAGHDQRVGHRPAVGRGVDPDAPEGPGAGPDSGRFHVGQDGWCGALDLHGTLRGRAMWARLSADATVP